MTTTSFDWTAVAPAWEAEQATLEVRQSLVAAAVLEPIALQPGEHVLELGGGTGTFAGWLADVVGPTGHVLTTDSAQGMVEAAQRTLAGRTNVDVRRMDAADVDLPDSSVDAVVSVMALMFLSDPGAALRGVKRVLRPGGRTASATWGGPGDNPWLTSVGMAAMMAGVVSGPVPTAPGGIFSLGDTDVVAQLYRDAGFTDVIVTTVDVVHPYASFDAYFDTVSRLAGPVAVAIAAAPDKLDQVRSTARDLAAPYTTDDGVALPGKAVVASAVAP